MIIQIDNSISHFQAVCQKQIELSQMVSMQQNRGQTALYIYLNTNTLPPIFVRETIPYSHSREK